MLRRGWWLLGIECLQEGKEQQLPPGEGVFPGPAKIMTSCVPTDFLYYFILIHTNPLQSSLPAAQT